jgi:hypothetical protein
MIPIGQWQKDSEVDNCGCGVKFALFTRRHHCRVCGQIFCSSCSKIYEAFANTRLCTGCYEVSWKRFQDGDAPGMEVDVTFVSDIIDQLQQNIEKGMTIQRDLIQNTFIPAEDKENSSAASGNAIASAVSVASVNKEAKLAELWNSAEEKNRKLMAKYKEMLSMEVKKTTVLAARRGSEEILAGMARRNSQESLRRKSLPQSVEDTSAYPGPSAGVMTDKKGPTTPRRTPLRPGSSQPSAPRSTRSVRRTVDISCFPSREQAGPVSPQEQGETHPRALQRDLDNVAGAICGQSVSELEQFRREALLREQERQKMRDQLWAEEQELLAQRNQKLRQQMLAVPQGEVHMPTGSTTPAKVRIMRGMAAAYPGMGDTLDGECELDMTGLSDLLEGI